MIVYVTTEIMENEDLIKLYFSLGVKYEDMNEMLCRGNELTMPWERDAMSWERDAMSWERDNYLAGTRCYVVGTR